MDILEFKLSGKTAFFKIPEVNTYRYITYSTIHKISLLGILGSIVGLKGYSHQGKDKYPQFYESLKNIKCSIEIVDPKRIIKKYQVFNNGVGYASKEQGNNLIVTEQWLENPEWIIRILLEDKNEIVEKIKDYILNFKCVYIPYLGKNDHFANISDAKIIKGEVIDLNTMNSSFKINGLYDDGLFKITAKGKFYKFSEYLPYKLDEVINNYVCMKMTQTDGMLSKIDNKSYNDLAMYKIDNGVIYFI